MSKNLITMVGVTATGAVGLWAVTVASAWRPEDGLYVVAVGWVIVVLALLNVVIDARKARRTAAVMPAAAPDVTASAPKPEPASADAAVSRLSALDRLLARNEARIVVAMALTVVYVFLWDDFGFLLTTMVFLFFMLLTLGVRRPIPIIAVTLGVPYFIDFTFGRLLSIPFP